MANKSGHDADRFRPSSLLGSLSIKCSVAGSKADTEKIASLFR